MRASLLVKEIYLRAHQSRLTGPSTASLDRPEVRLPSLSVPMQAAQDEQDKALKVLTAAQRMKRFQFEYDFIFKLKKKKKTNKKTFEFSY
jgi:hypothetical protein